MQQLSSYQKLSIYVYKCIQILYNITICLLARSNNTFAYLHNTFENVRYNFISRLQFTQQTTNSKEEEEKKKQQQSLWTNRCTRTSDGRQPKKRIAGLQLYTKRPSLIYRPVWMNRQSSHTKPKKIIIQLLYLLRCGTYATFLSTDFYTFPLENANKIETKRKFNIFELDDNKNLTTFYGVQCVLLSHTTFATANRNECVFICEKTQNCVWIVARRYSNKCPIFKLTKKIREHFYQF